MKKIILLLIAILAVTVFANAKSEVDASILRYEPAPAEQGRTIDIWMQFTNAGTIANNVAVKFVPEYPFSLPSGQKSELNVGRIAATETKVVKFTVFADPNAPNGENTIKFLYKAGSEDTWTQLETTITLQTQNAALIIEDYKVSPSPIVPGQIIDLELKVRNAGKISVKNVDVGIDLIDGKFTIIGSGAKKRIDVIESGKTTSISFKLASDTSTEVKVYSLPVSLIYQDTRNKEYNDTAKISVVVNANPEISLAIDSTTFTDKTTPGQVGVKVINKGIVNIKYVNVILLASQDYEILSPSNEAYVGNLDSDDFETVEFTIKPLVENPKLNVLLSFKDPYNANFNERYELPLRIITDADLGKSQASSWIIGIVLVLVVGGIIWFVRRKKKR